MTEQHLFILALVIVGCAFLLGLLYIILRFGWGAIKFDPQTATIAD